MNTQRAIRIGGAAGYWGDSVEAPGQLIRQGNVDYLIFDYLAEVTLSILVRARDRNPALGYATDFVQLIMNPLLREIRERNIRVVANCGGVNVSGCAAALAQLAEQQNINLKIGTVQGDDLMPQLERLRASGVTDMFSNRPLPAAMTSANAYLGAFPIAAALDAGADIVITGRCVDSALTLGPLIHEFNWSRHNYDKLAAGTLAGHIIECGAQATGGNFTDWQDVVDGWDNMGYPIAECRSDGTFSITKAAGTGGVVSQFSVGEQVLYEIGDPSQYVMPDVSCDFRATQLVQSAPDRVDVHGVRGAAATARYKVSATWHDGYRSTVQIGVAGFDCSAKARAYANALLTRCRRLFERDGLDNFHSTAVHVIGADALRGRHADASASAVAEVVLQIEVRHAQRAALQIFAREFTGVALSMTTGICPIGATGRPTITPVIAQFAFLVDQADVEPLVTIDGRALTISHAPARPPDTEQSATAELATEQPATTPAASANTIERPLIDLAVARSGDKGDTANIGVIARTDACYAFLKQALSAPRVASWFQNVTHGPVVRYELPGFNALNFVLSESLGGGGTSSLHLDKQAKTYAQQLLAMPMAVPQALAHSLPHRAARRR